MKCEWCLASKRYEEYHDLEWGRPVYDSKKLFSDLCLESMQAGLSFITVLNKREAYYDLFKHFDPDYLITLTQEDIDELKVNPQIIRSERKIKALITNAQAYKKIEEEHHSFSDFIWSFVDHQVIDNQPLNYEDVPNYDERAESMSKVLKKYGFKYVGPTICYAFMQASGLVNDHLITCEARLK